MIRRLLLLALIAGAIITGTFAGPVKAFTPSPWLYSPDDPILQDSLNALAGSGILQTGPHIYLGQWEWFTEETGVSYWRCPGGDCIGLLDLRPLPAQAKAGGTPEGYGIFVYDYAKSHDLFAHSAVYVARKV